MALKGEAKERASCRARCNLRFAPSHLSFPFPSHTLIAKRFINLRRFPVQSQFSRHHPIHLPTTSAAVSLASDPIHSFYACQSNNSLDQLSALSVGVTAFVAANSEAFCHHKAFREPPRLIPAALRLQYGPQRFHERPYPAVDLTLAPKKPEAR